MTVGFMRSQRMARRRSSQNSSEKSRRSFHLDFDVETLYEAALTLSPSERLELIQKLIATQPNDELTLTSLSPGMRIQTHVGWHEDRTVTKAGKCYVEHWFHWEEQDDLGQWKHKSRYICQHGQDKKPSLKAAEKLERLRQQIEQQRPYPETLSYFDKQKSPHSTKS